MVAPTPLAVCLVFLLPSIARTTPPDPIDTIGGKVVSIADGDTLTVLVGKTQLKVRLAGIDCPETKQPFGTRAKQFASKHAFGKVVTVKASGTDRYGRVIGVVILPDGKNLNRKLVKAGLAWWYRQYAPDDKKLAALETAAKKGKTGLWSDPKPIPPWEWRAKAKAREATVKPPAAASGEHWLNTASNTRHNSRCRWFRKTKQGRACGANEGKACGACGG